MAYEDGAGQLEDGKSIDLHQACLDTLTGAGYHIVAEHTPEQSYTVDGLIVTKAPGVGGADHVALMLARLRPELMRLCVCLIDHLC